MNMLDNIIVKVPNILELRAYTLQLINENVWFLKELRNYLVHNDPSLMSDDEIRNFLRTKCLLPDYLYFLKSNENSWSGKNLESGYQKITRFFTKVSNIYYLNNKIEFIVMVYYNNYILTLYDNNFKELVGDCENIEIGTNGNILLRFIGNPSWDYFSYNGQDLDYIYSCMDTDDIPDFYPISGRKVEIFHSNKNENPQLILKEDAPPKNNKNSDEESQIEDELFGFSWLA